MSKNEGRVHVYSISLAAFFVAAGFLTTGLLGAQLASEHHAQFESQQQLAVVQKQAVIKQKEQQIESLRRQLSEQKQQLSEKQQQITTLSSRSGTVLAPGASSWMHFTATWYDGQGGINGDQVTATGTYVRDNWTVAVDPTVIPLGSLVEVKLSDGTDHIYRAVDTGGAIKGGRIDIFNSDANYCMQKGKQSVELRILVRGYNR